MVTGDPSRGPLFGNIVHWLMMGTVAFGIGYAIVVEAVDTAAWLVGLVTGMVHGLLVGAVAMPMMPLMHPRMGERPRVGDGVVITSPGFFGLRWGAMTPLGIVMAHVVYGVVAATTYGALTV